MSNTILRNINLQTEVYEVVKAESARRRNGGKGFSLTLNQIVLEWVEAFNAGLLPHYLPNYKERLETMPAVKSVWHDPVPGIQREPEETNG